MLVFAHRGAHDHHAENTLASFEEAIRLGCHGIETDVRASADGLAVLVHDRVAPDGVPVSQLSRRELEQSFGHPIATLDEALALTAPLLWNIEIKTPAGWAAARDSLLRWQDSRRLLISSFNHALALEAARDGLPAAFLTASQPAAINTLLYGAQSEPALRHIVWDYEIIDRDQIRQCNALGFRTLVYGATLAEEIALCREYGAHGVITDAPQLALSLPA